MPRSITASLSFRSFSQCAVGASIYYLLLPLLLLLAHRVVLARRVLPLFPCLRRASCRWPSWRTCRGRGIAASLSEPRCLPLPPVTRPARHLVRCTHTVTHTRPHTHTHTRTQGPRGRGGCGRVRNARGVRTCSGTRFHRAGALAARAPDQWRAEFQNSLWSTSGRKECACVSCLSPWFIFGKKACLPHLTRPRRWRPMECGASFLSRIRKAQ